jgi:hypothetical protein
MTSNLLVTAAALSDHALLAHVQALAVRERLDSCELIAPLAVLDTRKVLAAEGHSLFTYRYEAVFGPWPSLAESTIAYPAVESRTAVGAGSRQAGADSLMTQSY